MRGGGRCYFYACLLSRASREWLGLCLSLSTDCESVKVKWRVDTERAVWAWALGIVARVDAEFARTNSSDDTCSDTFAAAQPPASCPGPGPFAVAAHQQSECPSARAIRLIRESGETRSCSTTGCGGGQSEPTARCGLCIEFTTTAGEPAIRPSSSRSIGHPWLQAMDVSATSNSLSAR